VSPSRDPGRSTKPRGAVCRKAVVDPEELRRFAHNLKSFTNDLHSSLSVLHGQLVALGNTWRDKEHEKFTPRI